LPGAGTGTILVVTDMLALAAHLPEVAFDAGDVVIEEGGEAGGVWVLLSGRLEVCKGGTRVNTIDKPGAIVGEVSLLLGSRHGATIKALEPTRARYASDGHALLLGDPEVTRLIAVGLAERLNYVTGYLADLKFQYGDTPGLAMVDTVLTRLAHRQDTPARSGSARDPDPDY
jgi:CRP-like cAMP-binding protein